MILGQTPELGLVGCCVLLSRVSCWSILLCRDVSGIGDQIMSYWISVKKTITSRKLLFVNWGCAHHLRQNHDNKAPPPSNAIFRHELQTMSGKLGPDFIFHIWRTQQQIAGQRHDCLLVYITCPLFHPETLIWETSSKQELFSGCILPWAHLKIFSDAGHFFSGMFCKISGLPCMSTSSWEGAQLAVSSYEYTD